MLELLRALNWTIRADVPWPTKRGQNFDFVLVGEPGVFAMWVYDGEPEGVEQAATGLSALVGGVRVRPVVCRRFASLGHAHPDVLYCTPETALDLLIGLPPHEDQGRIRGIASRLRDLEVPIPPEPEPGPVVIVPAPEPVVVVPAPKPAAQPPKPAPPEAEPLVVPPEPRVVPPEPRVAPAEPRSVPTEPRVVPPEPKSVAKVAPPVAPKPVVKESPPTPAPVIKTPPPAVEKPTPPPVVTAPAPEPKPERLPAGRHRSERPRFVRRTPPPPPADAPKATLPKSTLELPTALAPVPGRARGTNDAAARFDNSYVYTPEPVTGPGPLKREFRAKPFLTGLIAIIALVVVAGIGVKVWPHVAGLIKSDSNPSAAFGQTIRAESTNFHPTLTLSATLPQRVSTSRGLAAYALDLSVSNVGTASWALPRTSAFVMVDSLGESHPLTSISGVASSRWAGSLKPAQSWSGRLVFTLKSGRTPLRLRFALATDGSETATWHH